MARALAAGRPPVPRPAYPRRHLWMDAVALPPWTGGGWWSGVLDRLFDRNSAERVLRFLDCATSPAEDLAVMRSSSLLPMTGAVVGDGVDRLRLRVDRLAARLRR